MKSKKRWELYELVSASANVSAVLSFLNCHFYHACCFRAYIFTQVLLCASCSYVFLAFPYRNLRAARLLKWVALALLETCIFVHPATYSLFPAVKQSRRCHMYTGLPEVPRWLRFVLETVIDWTVALLRIFLACGAKQPIPWPTWVIQPYLSNQKDGSTYSGVLFTMVGRLWPPESHANPNMATE